MVRLYEKGWPIPPEVQQRIEKAFEEWARQHSAAALERTGTLLAKQSSREVAGHPNLSRAELHAQLDEILDSGLGIEVDEVVEAIKGGVHDVRQPETTEPQAAQDARPLQRKKPRRRRG